MSAELYFLILHIHLGSVTLSVALFTARGWGVITGRAWPMRKSVRWLSVVIDSVLLGAGVSLWTLLELNPLVQHWLALKLVLLLVYIGLGTLALKRGRTVVIKRRAWFGAMACVGLMVGIALARHPLGWIYLVLQSIAA